MLKPKIIANVIWPNTDGPANTLIPKSNKHACPQFVCALLRPVLAKCLPKTRNKQHAAEIRDVPAAIFETTDKRVT